MSADPSLPGAELQAQDPRTDAGLDHVARLARLTLQADEREGVRAHMVKVLDWFGALSAIDTEGVSAAQSDRPVGAEGLRADAARPSLERDAALANAPARDERGFVVPQVVSE